MNRDFVEILHELSAAGAEFLVVGAPFASIFGLDPRDLLGEALGLPPLTPPAAPAPNG